MYKQNTPFRSYSHQQIDQAIREVLLDSLLSTSDLSQAIELFEKYKKAFIETKEQSLYSQYANPEHWDSSLKIIKDRISNKSHFFEEILSSSLEV